MQNDKVSKLVEVLTDTTNLLIKKSIMQWKTISVDGTVTNGNLLTFANMDLGNNRNLDIYIPVDTISKIKNACENADLIKKGFSKFSFKVKENGKFEFEMN